MAACDAHRLHPGAATSRSGGGDSRTLAKELTATGPPVSGLAP